jgi:hypothetical protein
MPTQIMTNGETYAFMGKAAAQLHPVTLLVINPSAVQTSKREKVPPFGQIPKNNEDIIKR